MSDFFKTDDDFYKTTGEYRESLIKTAQIKLFDIYEAEDAVSEALLKACEKRDQLRDEKKLYYWILRILINHCNDILRVKLKERYSDKDIATLNTADKRIMEPIERYERAIEIEKVLDIMLTLEPEEQSEVAILYFYRKFNYDKIAEILEIPIGTVKSRLNRAKKSLKEALLEKGVTFEDLKRIEDIGRWPEIRLVE